VPFYLKILILCSLILSISATSKAQDGKLIPSEISPVLTSTIKKNLALGGYGDIEFVQRINSNEFTAGKLDIHRFVMLMAYQFNPKVKMVTEIEFEHVKEVFVEQLFIDYKINKALNWRSGLILIPMGIINERHESNTFNGTLRPFVDKYIVPTTWREIGTGFHGNIIDASLRYQVYAVNGFSGYNGGAVLNGSNGLRSGRQKGAKSYISSPNLSSKIEYYGVPNLNIGLATYFGKTQSTAFNGIDKNDKEIVAAADSTRVGIAMLGVDARYLKNGWQLKAQGIYTNINNTIAYNKYTGTDLAAILLGYYVEAAYNVWHKNDEKKDEILPFVRYEVYNTHQKMETGYNINKSYNRSAITAGLTWKPNSLIAYKVDVQSLANQVEDANNELFFNAGIGFAF